MPSWILVQLPAIKLNTGPPSGHGAGYRSSCRLPDQLLAAKPDAGRIPISIWGQMLAAKLAAGPAAGSDAGTDSGPGTRLTFGSRPEQVNVVSLELNVSDIHFFRFNSKK